MKGTIKRALAGIAAAAVAAAGLAVGAVSANAAEHDLVLGTTITLNAQNSSQFDGRAYQYVKLADFTEYYDHRNEPENPVPSQLVVTTTDNNFVSGIILSVLNSVGEDSERIFDYDPQTDGDPMAWVAQNLNDSQESPYAGELRNFVQLVEETLDKADFTWSTATLTGEGTQREFDVSDEGLYLVREASPTGPTNDATTSSIPMLVGTSVTVREGAVSGTKAPEYATGVVNLKSEIMTTGKTVDDSSASINDTRKYTITANVPNWNGKDPDTLSFKFTDAPSAGQTVHFDTIRVSVVDKETGMELVEERSLTGGELTKPSGVDENDWPPETGTGELKDAINDPNKSFTITLTDAMRSWALMDNLIGQTVKVTYDVTINSYAEKKNHVVTNNSGSTVKAEATIEKAASFEVTKQDASGMGLQGAVFQISKADSDGEYDVLPVSWDSTFGAYVPDASGQSTVTTGNTGRLSFTGFGRGEYLVTEVSAPEGYWGYDTAQDGRVVSFKVSVDAGGNPIFSKDYDPLGLVVIPGASTRAAIPGVIVKNINSITQLPLTGAAGITMFVVLGLLIAGVGVTVYVKSRGVRNALRG